MRPDSRYARATQGLIPSPILIFCVLNPDHDCLVQIDPQSGGRRRVKLTVIQDHQGPARLLHHLSSRDQCQRSGSACFIFRHPLDQRPASEPSGRQDLV